ncbi:MAG TPA: cytochrome c3 family protein [Acidobacteriota bacterium]|nr:cytochrome c3 family protein [Acidobacteriota bacterium]
MKNAAPLRIRRAAIVLSFVLPLVALAADTEDTVQPTLDCLQCHTCERPTPSDMCLQPCPSLTMAQNVVPHSLSEAPDSMLLGDIADVFKPVHFNHKLHAEMAEMGGDCATCHHYSPAGEIPPCRDCHGGEGNPTNLRQPGLKGAYHRQCLSCHREWSHETRCVLCHLPEAGREMAAVADPTDIIGIPHPVITEPETKIYRTPYNEGPVVTFHHAEHIHLFGLNCANCHQKENCGFCHDLQKPATLAKSMEEVHAICNDCHVNDACGKCHDTKEKPVFSHASTGWPLNRYHRTLDCRACHPTGRQIGRLNSNCGACHAGWNQENFAHAVTGLQLDEIHVELDCTDCHADRKFDQTPDCSACHDDGRTHEDAPPGELLSSR